MSRLKQAIERDVETELYDGAVTMVAIGGEMLFNETIGYADRPGGTALEENSVFPVFSISKSITCMTMLQRVERGEVRLNTPVADLIPEFGVKGKQRATIGQLMSHMAGLGSSFPPVAAEDQGNLDIVVEAVCATAAQAVPGEETSYAPIMAHAIIAEGVRRLDGSNLSFRDIVTRDLLEPLGMMDTCLGMRADLAARGIVPRCADDSPGLFDGEALVAVANDIMNPALDYEMPAAGFVSTAGDIFNLAESLRRGGELNGTRVLSPATVDFAAQNHTGEMRNNLWSFAREMKGWPSFPANLGLGFFRRGEGMIPTWIGHLASNKAYGGMGAGSTNFWIDPEKDMVMVCLTSGLLEETNSQARFQRLSDVAMAEFYR
ncbi:MAG: beta-lactamase family protein [Rhodospirillaceae bacterium]|nr:beta-lactamase family protein [Rhodospirillaceae bacterium]MBT5675020.1 beta-lactamase family protein [Rhodospirillaceae bacterium]MBT6830120.1 beta-lactamase family protein [Rhodospirillaceae bacterium]